MALEADHDTPRFAEYEFKGGAEQFPALLVLERSSRRILGRFPWPGAASEREALLRDRTQIKWRPDSGAVAINTRDSFYAHSLVLAADRDSGRFAEVSTPPYTELTGRPLPPAEKLRSRGRSIAIRWTPEGLLVFEVWLWGEVNYPLSSNRASHESKPSAAAESKAIATLRDTVGALAAFHDACDGYPRDLVGTIHAADTHQAGPTDPEVR